MNAQHSSESDGWLTPLWLLEKVHAVLGEIDIDPASSAYGNRRVKARSFYGHRTDGLSEPWNGAFFCNPPGGTRILAGLDGGTGRPQSQQILFWAKAMLEIQTGRASHGIFLSFSLEALSRSQARTFPAMTEFPICIPPKRVRYDRPDGTPGPSPTHASALVYVPGKTDVTGLFARVFQDVGALLSPGVPFRHQSTKFTLAEEQAAIRSSSGRR